MIKLSPIRSRNQGYTQVEDIVQAIEQRLPAYLRAERKFLTDEQFKKLPRDPDGNIIGISTKAHYNLFTLEQLKSITQHDKDDIREALNIRMRKINI